MIASAMTVGSKIVRCVLGSAEDRKPGPIDKHIESMVKVLRNMRSRAMDANIKIAIENHAGDMQGWELRNLIEAAGKDFVGACLDSGNPCWTLEDPHVTLETLASLRADQPCPRQRGVARAAGRGGYLGAHGRRQCRYRRVIAGSTRACARDALYRWNAS